LLDPLTKLTQKIFMIIALLDLELKTFLLLLSMFDLFLSLSPDLLCTYLILSNLFCKFFIIC